MRKRDWKGLLLFGLFDLHAAAFLLRLPFALVATLRALWPYGAVPNHDLLAFGRRDALIRPWYAKVARDQRRFGRLGLVWNDGFGTPMNFRFYNNWLTYALYGRLGLRGYTAAGLLLVLAVPFALRSAGWQWPPALVASVLLAGSPVVLGSLFHLGKPECLWWVFLAPQVFFAATGQWAWAGAVFSLLAFANFPVAFGSGLTMLLQLAFFWPGTAALLPLGLAMAPGALKTLLRVIPFLKAGGLGGLVREQSEGEMRPRRVWFQVAYHVAVAAAAWTLATATSPLSRPILLFAGAILAVYVAGQTLFYLNDPQSFRLWHLAIYLATLALIPSWPGVVGLALLSYERVRECGFRPPRPAKSFTQWEGDWASDAGRAAWETFAAYPLFNPLSRRSVLAPLRPLFDVAPDGRRILVETHSASLSFGGYRAFLQICEEFLPLRDVEVFPDEWVRMSCRRFYETYFARFDASGGAPDPGLLVEAVGASFVLATTAEFESALVSKGFSPASRLRRADVPEELADLLALPPADLVLLRAPGERGRVTPAAAHRWEGADLAIEAPSAGTYRVRYAHHPNLRARQGSRDLEVRRVVAVPDSDLHLVEVDVPEAGTVTLHYARTPF